MTTLAHELVERGHELHIVTALPWYRNHAIEPEWRGRPIQVEHPAWGRISRINPLPTNKANLVSRAAAFGGFTASSAVVAAASRWRPEVVLAMSPPLTLGVGGAAVAKRFGVPFVFNVQDVFPDVAVEVGAITNDRAIAAARWLERKVYDQADAVTVLSEDLQDNVEAKLAADSRADKVVVIPNFVDTTAIVPGDRMTSYRSEFGLGDRTVVMYAGNVGYSQSLELVVEAARAFAADRPDVVFVINGGGSALESLKEQARGLENLVFVGLQPKARLPEVMASGDIHVVALRKGLARSSVPSKLYSILAGGRAVLASVDPGTEVANCVDAAGAGRVVAPEDAESFVAALRVLVDSPEKIAEMGANGRQFVERWLSPAECAQRYENLFEHLVSREQRPAKG
jgi:colanic acid biosynthesis glycosyl transferase WcaI